MDVNNTIKHDGVQKVLDKYRLASSCSNHLHSMLNELKPYIAADLCKVRFVNKYTSPNKVELMTNDEEKLGYGPIRFYTLYKNPRTMTGIFKDIAILIIFKKIQDIKEDELMSGLKNSTVHQIR